MGKLNYSLVFIFKCLQQLYKHTKAIKECIYIIVCLLQNDLNKIKFGDVGYKRAVKISELEKVHRSLF